MTIPTKTESITLFFRQERSDKVYKAYLEETEGNYIVNFAYGRRGATLKTGTKTQAPVAYEKAKKIYDKLVLSKASKGYVPDEDSSNYIVDTEQRKTGIHCQLLNPIEESELENFFNDDDWCLQEKMDGKRMLIKKTKEETIAINRRGLSVGAPEQMINSANAIESTFIIDGEAIDDTLYAFDILSFNEEDLKAKSYIDRYEILKSISFSEKIEIVALIEGIESKQALFQQLKDDCKEGVVFKNLNSAYAAGRPNSGGNQIKFKFYDTVSVIVSKINDKRSIGMSLIENGEDIFVGNVTISVNKEIPKLDEIIEVRYLYAYKGGSIYQPTFLSVRDDMERENCLLTQLKYKPEV
ncbi:RNA ligase family protein [Maribacter aquivivus]|uniref:ATP-dependent DNA ligase n=1 Tax=Maribacter aquivivus TaxID=228958 RepID=UPI00249118CC|nr:RNA ligase family protein [Maribacter aquivivus]